MKRFVWFSLKSCVLFVLLLITLYKADGIKRRINLYTQEIKNWCFSEESIESLETPADAWFISDSPILIAHSGGGINGYVYTNSKEAILQSIASGYRVIEVDVSMTSDGVPVLSHDFRPDHEQLFNSLPTLEVFLNTPMECNLTPLTLSDFVKLIEGWDGTVLLDIRSDKYARSGRTAFFEWLKRESLPTSSAKFLFQACSPREVAIYKSLGYSVTALHYNLSNLNDFKKEIQFLVKERIQTISIADNAMVNKELLRWLHDANLYYFVHTINHKSR